MAKRGKAIGGRAEAGRRSKRARSARVAVWLIMLATLFAFAWWARVVILATPPSPTRATFAQIGTLFDMYADESKGQKLPPLDGVPGAFLPDMTRPDSHGGSSWKPADDVRAYLKQRQGDLCYTGYLMLNEETGMAFLDKYEARGGAGPWGQDIDLGDKLIDLDGYDRTSKILVLREGVERFTIHEISNAAASEQAQKSIPVLWEMPNASDTPGGWVLYMDGHTEWRPYPGEFPMTPAFMMRLNTLMTPRTESIAAREGLLADELNQANAFASSPAYALATAVMDCVWPNPPSTWWYKSRGHSCVTQCDSEPSVEAGGSRGYRVVLRKTKYDYLDWRPTLFGVLREKLQVHFGGVPGVRAKHSHLDLVLFPTPLENPEAIKPSIPWPRLEHEEPVTVLHMGEGHGYVWFGRMTIRQHLDVHARLDLAGSDDLLRLAKRHLRWAWSNQKKLEAYGLMVEAGERAVPELQKALRRDARNREHIIYALHLVGGGLATETLLDVYHSGDPDSARTAAWALLRPPRKEAKEVYLAFLERDDFEASPHEINAVADAVIQFGWQETKAAWLGKLAQKEPPDDSIILMRPEERREAIPFYAPAKVAAHFGWKEAIPLLDAYCTMPDSMMTYRFAYELRREVEGLSVPDDLEEHERVIRDLTWRLPYTLRSTPEQVEAAKQALIACPDKEAVALVAISLATTDGGGKGGPRVDRRLFADGLAIARTLPREAMAYHLRRLAVLQYVGLVELNQEFLANAPRDELRQADPADTASSCAFAPSDRHLPSPESSSVP